MTANTKKVHIKIDAKNWTREIDFYDAILPAIGAPEWHGYSIDALLDTIVWGEFNQLKPPYVIEIHDTKNLPPKVLQELMQARQSIKRAREEHQQRKGYDVDVEFQITD